MRQRIPTPTGSPRTNRPISLERLERRALLAADANLAEGILTVRADDRPNEISVFAEESPGKLTVKVDSQVFLFRNHLVRHIQIDSKGGDDVIFIADTIRQTTTIDGGGGNDAISGSQQSDTILGGLGNDRISGRDGNDRLDGGDGNDRIGGGRGNDSIAGGRGSDLLRGGSDEDQIYGDGAFDTESSDEGSSQSFANVLSRTESFRARKLTALEDPAFDPPLNESQALSNSDLIFGDDGNDLVRAGAGNDVVFGGRGNDSMSGGSGGDYVEGEAGEDRIDGGSGSDVLFGGEGNDSIGGGRDDDYAIGGAGDDAIEGGGGNDWLFGDATNSYPAGYIDPFLYAREFANTNRGEDRLFGGEGNDFLLGGNGNDQMAGGTGDDLLIGGRGSDSLAGDGGADVIDAKDGEVDRVFADLLDTLLVDDIDRVVRN